MKLDQTIIEIHWGCNPPFENDLAEKMFERGFVRDKVNTCNSQDIWVRKAPSRPRYWNWLDDIADQYKAEKIYIRFECDYLDFRSSLKSGRPG